MSVLLQTPPRAGSRILAFGAARGDVRVPNSELVAAIDSSDEWIRQRTGMIERRRASAGIEAVDLAETASRQAIERAGIRPDQLGAVIVSTVSNTVQTPSLAALLTARIGAQPAPAYDISAACAGFTYGVAQADALIRSGAAEYVLVLGAEKLSQFALPTDRTISFLLADGAGAAVLGPAATPGVSTAVWGSDGSRWDAVGMSAPLAAYRAGEADWPTLRQEGGTVFRWAVWEMAKVAQRALDLAGVEPGDLAAFIPHQANMRIIDELAKQLHLPETVTIARDIAYTGNTSAASVPLAADALLTDHPDLSGGLALLIGFGAGLVFGAQVVVLP